MEIKEFMEMSAEAVKERVGEQINVTAHNVVKNNGLVLHALTIKEQDMNITPTIYVDGFFQCYKEGKMSLEEIAEKVIEIHEHNRVSKEFNFKEFLNFDMISKKIIYKAVNAEMNIGLLQNIPHMKVMDLAIIFQILVGIEGSETATITIQNEHLRIWKKSVDEIFDVAKENTPSILVSSIKPIRQVIESMIEYVDEFEVPEKDVPMYVLSNKTGVNGAATMFYPEVLKDFAISLSCDLYILPSSTHEVIILPTNGKDDTNSLRYMVQEINETQVELDEVLSNNVYYYSLENDSLNIA